MTVRRPVAGTAPMTALDDPRAPVPSPSRAGQAASPADSSGPIEPLIATAAGTQADSGGSEMTGAAEHDVLADRVFASAAELFGLLATPIRLRIVSAVCQAEKNVSELLSEIDTTQSNMSQHLASLHRSGVLSRRRAGAQVYYGLQSERVAMLCRAVCTQVAIEIDAGDEMPPSDRLLPNGPR